MEEQLSSNLYEVRKIFSTTGSNEAFSGGLQEDINTHDKDEAKAEKPVVHILTGEHENSSESPLNNLLVKPEQVQLPVETKAEVKLKSENSSEGEQQDTRKRTEDEIRRKYVSLRKTSRLWVYKPVPENEPYPAEEIIFSDYPLEWGNVTAARVRGKSHMHYGTNCDDWYELKKSDENGIFCAAVSDGAGSCKFSRIGSRLICGFAVDFLLRQVKEKIQMCPEFREMLENGTVLTEKVRENLISMMVYTALQTRNLLVTDAVWRRNIPEYSDIKDSKDLSATLMLVLIVPLKKDFLVVSFQVGDGVIALINRKAASCSEAITVMGNLDRGDFAGETQFITSLNFQEFDKWPERVKIWQGSFDTMLIMSDGVSEDYMPFNPELCRLYLDILANNIFPDELKQYENEVCNKMCNPLIFPNVRDPEVKVALNYTWSILYKSGLRLKFGLSLDDLWKHREIITCAASKSSLKGTSGERLSQWLDNYVEISSSDDRTLVVIRRA